MRTIHLTRRVRACTEVPSATPGRALSDIEQEMRAHRALLNANFERRIPAPTDSDQPSEAALRALLQLVKE